MAKTKLHREYDTYVDSPTRPDKAAVEIVGSFSTHKFTPPLNADTITISYPSSTTEVYEYRQGGATGTVLSTVTVTYVNSSKNDLSKVEVT